MCTFRRQKIFLKHSSSFLFADFRFCLKTYSQKAQLAKNGINYEESNINVLHYIIQYVIMQSIYKITRRIIFSLCSHRLVPCRDSHSLVYITSTSFMDCILYQSEQICSRSYVVGECLKKTMATL